MPSSAQLVAVNVGSSPAPESVTFAAYRDSSSSCRLRTADRDNFGDGSATPRLPPWTSNSSAGRPGQYFDYLGFDIFYRVEGTGPTLLLIHGYPFNTFDWAPIWPTLTDRFTVIAPDMIGMGFSDKPVKYQYSVHAHADMHEALLAHLGVDRCHVLAHDLGDSVGQELLARFVFGQQTYRAVTIDSVTC